MRTRSTDVLVAALGALLAHEVAYGVVDVALGPPHGHLAALLGVLLPLGGIAIVRLVARSLTAPLASVPALSLVQVLLFLVLEGAEHAGIGGLHALLTNPAVLLGLGLQPVIAGLFHFTIRHGRSVVARTTSTAPFVPHVPTLALAPRPLPRVRSALSLLPLLRGPPAMVAT